MKRIASMIVVLVLALGTLSFAQEKEQTFFFNGYFLTYGTWDTTVIGEGMKAGGESGVAGSFKNQQYSFWSQRVRPYFSYKTENVEASLRFEMDWIMGGGDSAAVLGFSTGKHPNIGAGSDTPNFLELKQAYIKVNVPEVSGLSLQAGIFGYFFAGWGATYYCEETPQAKVTYAFGNKNTFGQSNVSFTYIPFKNAKTFKYEEINGAEVKGTYGMNGYAIEGNYTMDSESMVLKVTPTVLFIDNGNASGATLYKGGLGYTPGIGFLGLFDARITVLFNVAMPMGKSNVKVGGKETEYSALMAYLDVNYAAVKSPKNIVKLGLHVNYLSGDDKTTDNEINALTDQQQDGITPLGGRYWFFQTGVFSPLAGGNNLIYNPADVVRYNPQGALIAGLYADIKLDKFNAYVGFAFAQLMEDNAGTAEKEKSLGMELDLSVSYQVEKARIFAEFAYLMAGKGYVNKGTSGNFMQSAITKEQNAMHFAVGMDLTF